ncbi:MAG: hypothetical protein FRC54_08815 [bacterium LCO1.1]|uniref:Uncharacterized protein n=1 Tax=Candidatus Weimeria bifida TaxID=2599074 RepID=A0A6N7J060_9FIRM|nr:hypothetical protein [Candidatus Weimeria bifida]
MTSDPNAKLSPEEIAKLFAAANGDNEYATEETSEPEKEPEKEPENTPEPEPKSTPEPVIAPESAPAAPTGDPNAKLSPEEIAKLFAAANGDNNSTSEKKEEKKTADDTKPAEQAKTETTDNTGANSDPNRMMTPEEIEALFSKV